MKKLKETFAFIQQLDKNMSNLRTWLARIESELSKPVVYDVCDDQEIQKRLAEQQVRDGKECQEERRHPGRPRPSAVFHSVCEASVSECLLPLHVALGEIEQTVLKMRTLIMRLGEVFIFVFLVFYII